jgi:hypothetical protein
MSNDKIPGVPEGWVLVRIGHPVIGVDCVIDYNGDIVVFRGNPNVNSGANWPIIRKIEKPARYRPFKDAEEFKPHRDRWLTRKDKSDPTHVDGACRVVAYDDQGSWFATGNYHTWEAAFDSGRCFDDDGTPFGVEVQ